MDQWEVVAKRTGYSDTKEMLVDLYITNGLSIFTIARMLGWSTFAVRKRLLMAGIRLRRRGRRLNVPQKKETA